jgi:hypothetical protein
MWGLALVAALPHKRAKANASTVNEAIQVDGHDATALSNGLEPVKGKIHTTLHSAPND